MWPHNRLKMHWNPHRTDIGQSGWCATAEILDAGWTVVPTVTKIQAQAAKAAATATATAARQQQQQQQQQQAHVSVLGCFGRATAGVLSKSILVPLCVLSQFWQQPSS